MDFNTEIKKLNKEQLDAVNTIYGPVMVVAGPGTGKTQMLALRIANILKQTDYNPESILCLTFTEAGAKAMQERLFRFIGKDSYYVAVNTFHSFTNDIIQNHPEHFAFAKDLLQLDDLNSLKILREIIDKDESLDQLRPFHNRYAKAPLILKSIQNLKKDGITPEILEQRVTKLKKTHEENAVLTRSGNPTRIWKDKQKKIQQLEEFIKVYKKYQEKLKVNGYYDYEDMIMFVIEKFKQDKNFLEDYHIKYQFLLVDEYQDTNGSQNELVNLLANTDKPNIFVVGDDDQSIYRFQGANVGNILHFTKNFPEAKIIVTKTNYRSSQLILDAAASVIDNNQTRLTKYIPNLDKSLRSASQKSTSSILHFEFETQDEENIFLAQEINRLHKAGVRYSDIAVIFRKNKHAEDISQALNKFNVPTQVSISDNIFENEKVLELLNILRVVSLHNTPETLLYEVMTYPYFNIDIVDLYKLLKYAKREKLSLADILILQDESVLKNNFHLSGELKKFADNIKKWHRNSKISSVLNFVLDLINELDFVKYLAIKDQDTKNDRGEASEKLSDILSVKSLIEFLSLQEKLGGRGSLESILKDIEIASENNVNISVPTASIKEDSVQLLTAHSSKGLEFEYVFIVKATDNNWEVKKSSPKILLPEILSEEASAFEDVSDKDLELEDERRLFYVAMTRAKKGLYITNADEYPSGNSFTSSVASLFVNEIKPSLLETRRVNKDTNLDIKNYLTLLRPNKIINIKEKERNFLLNQVKNFKLSASALNTYINSPIKFFENYIICIPQPQNHFAALGTAIHYALNQLNLAFITNKITKSSDMSLDEILGFFNYKLTKDFADHERFEDTLKEGKKILTGYYVEYIQTNLYREPCESEFTFKNAYLEIPGDRPIELTGRVDKIEKINDFGDVRIVDYKTSSPMSKNAIKGNTKTSTGDYWRQLVFYKLLTEKASMFAPTKKSTPLSNIGLSTPKYTAKEFEIDFLKPNTSNKFQKATFEVTQDDLTELTNLIINVVGKIRRLEFPETFVFDPLE